MKTFLAIMALAFTLTACGTSGPQGATGGAVTGPTINVDCQKVTAAGGGTQGDTTVTVNCPRDSQNPVTTAGEGSEQ